MVTLLHLLQIVYDARWPQSNLVDEVENFLIESAGEVGCCLHLSLVVGHEIVHEY